MQTGVAVFYIDSGLPPWVHGIKLFLNSVRGQVGRVLRELPTCFNFYLSSFWECLCGPGFGVVLRNHTTFSLPFHKRERERDTCVLTIHLLMWHITLGWKKKTLGRQRSTQNAGICSKMGIHLIKAQIFSFHKIALIADAHQNNFWWYDLRDFLVIWLKRNGNNWVALLCLFPSQTPKPLSIPFNMPL